LDLLTSGWEATPDFHERRLAGVARGYFRAVAFWIVAGLFAGLTYSFQFIPGWGEALVPPSAVHSVGRLRMAHSTVMLHGVVVNLFLGALCAVCSDTRRRPGGAGTAWFGFALLQGSLLAGVLAVLYGEVQASAFGELPVWADAGLLIGWVVAMGVLITAPRREDDPWIGGVYPWLAVAALGGLVVQTANAGLAYLPLPQDEAARLAAAVQSGYLHAWLLPLGIAPMIYFLKFRLPLPGWSRWWLGLLALAAALTAPLSGSELYLTEPLPIGLLVPALVAGTAYFGTIGVLGAAFALALRRGMSERLEPRPWNARATLWFAGGMGGGAGVCGAARADDTRRGVPGVGAIHGLGGGAPSFVVAGGGGGVGIRVAGRIVAGAPA
jgi:hypothetical protein